jgi:hypothetical protein
MILGNLQSINMVLCTPSQDIVTIPIVVLHYSTIPAYVEQIMHLKCFKTFKSLCFCGALCHMGIQA